VTSRIFIFHAVALFAIPLRAAESPVVTLDPHNILVDRFMGLGVQIDPFEYPPSEAAWKLTLQRLDYMHPAFFRVMWRADAYWRGFDDAGNPKYIWNEGEDVAAKRLAPLFAILDYAQAHKIDVMLGEWDPPKGLTPQDPRWARIITAFVNYLTARRSYTVIRFYNYMNEPNGNWMWPQGKVDYAGWAEGMRNLRREFDAHNLKSLPIAGPDNSGDWDWIDRCAKDLTPQIGLWDMHWYVKDEELLHDDIEKLLTAKRAMLLKADPQALSKGLYMAEAGVIQGRVNGDQQPRVKDFVYGVLMADFVAQVARAGWMGASAWDLDDAIHVVNGREHPAVPDDLTLKIWGFWNTQGARMGHPEDEALRPWFYTWSLMSRLFPKGSRIMAASQAAEGVRVMASTAQAGLSIMVVNDSDTPQSLFVRLPDAGKKTLTSYHYFAEDRPHDRDGYPNPKERLADADLDRGVKVDLPTRGAIFLTTIDQP
jgi:hypothetical protein